jgi:predicted flap endonuclease-1-like 5' DNA nuclease
MAKAYRKAAEAVDHEEAATAVAAEAMSAEVPTADAVAEVEASSMKALAMLHGSVGVIHSVETRLAEIKVMMPDALAAAVGVDVRNFLLALDEML